MERSLGNLCPTHRNGAGVKRSFWDTFDASKREIFGMKTLGWEGVDLRKARKFGSNRRGGAGAASQLCFCGLAGGSHGIGIAPELLGFSSLLKIPIRLEGFWDKSLRDPLGVCLFRVQRREVRYPVRVLSSLPSPPRSPPSAQLPQVPADPAAQPGNHQPGVGSPRASQRGHHGIHPPIPALYVPRPPLGDKSGNSSLPAFSQGREIHEELETSMVGQTGVGRGPGHLQRGWWVLGSSPESNFEGKSAGSRI